MTAAEEELESGVETRDRPEGACAADDPCQVCGEVMGDWWGTVKVEALWGPGHAPLGKIFTYQPVHSACWWETHPEAQARLEGRVADRKRRDQPGSTHA
jgi:hypothetical protein